VIRTRRGTRPLRAAEIDWVAVRRRIAGVAPRELEALTAEQAEAVLAQRARALAAVTESAVDRSAGIDAVVVRIAGERYAVPAAFVWRVVGTTDVAAVPGAPPSLLGVMNLHGEVLPVFDPRRLLGLAPHAPGEAGRIVVLGGAAAELGLAVDAADDFARVTIDQLHAPPDSLAPDRRELLHGVTSDGVIVLDGGKLLADPRLCVAPGSGRSRPATQEMR
jgi:purine-binding chemotaxis protein CheW